MFNPFAADFIANPYPYYRRLRSVDPVFRTPLGSWLVTRYEDVNRVLRDRRFVRCAARSFKELYGPGALDEPILGVLSKTALLSDPPVHTRLRGLIAKAFGARQFEDMRCHIQQIVDQLLDRVEPRRGMDIIHDYAYALSLTVICDLLGLPDEGRPQFRINGKVLSGLPLERAEIDELNAQILSLNEYFRSLIERRRRQPGKDLTSYMVQAEEEGDKLSEDELLANLIMLFIAGHETTANLVGNGLLALYRHPQELQRLRADPRMAANAVEEFLRFESVVQYVGRTVQEDVEIGGKLIAAGDWVLASLGAGNRDPAVFANPDRLDISRTNIRPLSFGGGIHFCIGAQLARIEAEIAITTLLRRLPALEIEDVERPKWRSVLVFRSLEELRAHW